jgi:hypothetical protein
VTAEDEFVVHQDQVWRERSNFIIQAELPDADRRRRFEQLFAKQVDGDFFEVCCIPFLLYDIALGDIVATSPKRGRKYVVTKVVEASGRFVFRVWFGESFHLRDEVAEALIELGCLVEWSSRNLLAVDGADDGEAQRVADFLTEKEQAGELIYETGRS